MSRRFFDWTGFGSPRGGPELGDAVMTIDGCSECEQSRGMAGLGEWVQGAFGARVWVEPTVATSRPATSAPKPCKGSGIPCTSDGDCCTGRCWAPSYTCGIIAPGSTAMPASKPAGTSVWSSIWGAVGGTVTATAKTAVTTAITNRLAPAQDAASQQIIMIGNTGVKKSHLVVGGAAIVAAILILKR